MMTFVRLKNSSNNNNNNTNFHQNYTMERLYNLNHLHNRIDLLNNNGHQDSYHYNHHCNHNLMIPIELTTMACQHMNNDNNDSRNESLWTILQRALHLLLFLFHRVVTLLVCVILFLEYPTDLRASIAVVVAADLILQSICIRGV